MNPSHFSESDRSILEPDLLIFWVIPFHFFGSALPFFWVRPFISFGQSFLLFWVRPSHFFGPVHPILFESDLLILFSKLWFNYFEFILQFMCLISRCVTWDVNRKYTFQWRKWFWGGSNKLFLCRVYMHWNFRIFNCVIWTSN